MTPRVGESVRHALLSGGGAWPDVSLDGLEVLPGGGVELLRVPAVRPSLDAAPAAPAPSGLALDDDCGLYLSDAARRRIVRVGLDCGQRTEVAIDVPGRPSGICVGPHGWLLVADPERGAVLVFALPALTQREAWTAGLDAPVGLAADGGRGVFVLDARAGRVLRLEASGRVDAAVSARLAAATAPVAIATGADGMLYVADGAARAVLRFTRDGLPIAPALSIDPAPRALAVGGDVLYAADPPAGRVRRLDRHDGRALGTIDGFHGPVSALAAARDGTVYVKTGADDAYVVGVPGAGREPEGSLTAGPLDAGEEGTWIRLAVDAEVPAGGAVVVETAHGAAAPAAWSPAPGLDSRVDGDRFLWVRVALRRGDDGASPAVAEVRANGDGDSYLAYLPAVYARDDGDGFLERLLGLVQARFGDLERVIDLAPRRLDPAGAPARWLPWIARLQAFDVPERFLGADRAEALRALLAEVPALYERRGTPAGVARAAEIHTGVRPVIVEDFAARRIWMLDATSVLGFDTGLPAADPDGIVLGDSVAGASGPEDPDAWGSALFRPGAHRFTVFVAAGAVRDDAARRRLRGVLDAEKPAHTEYRLCTVEPRLRVGVQARLGVDAIVAGPGMGLAVDEVRLGLDSRLADGPRGHVGVDTIVG